MKLTRRDLLLGSAALGAGALGGKLLADAVTKPTFPEPLPEKLSILSSTYTWRGPTTDNLHNLPREGEAYIEHHSCSWVQVDGNYLPVWK